MENTIWDNLKYILRDLRYLTLFPKKYPVPEGKGDEYWREVRRRRNEMKKVLRGTDCHWHIIEYNDGHKELTYLSCHAWGIFGASAIYRGLLFPRIVDFVDFANIKRIYTAF